MNTYGLEKTIAKLKKASAFVDPPEAYLRLIRALELCLTDFEESDTPDGPNTFVNDGIRSKIADALEGK